MKENMLTYTLSQTCEVLNISMPTALNLAHQQGFPAFKVGRKWLVSVEGLNLWLAEQCDAYNEERRLIS